MPKNQLNPLEEILNSRLSFKGDLSQLTSDFLRSRERILINNRLLNDLLLEKYTKLVEKLDEPEKSQTDAKTLIEQADGEDKQAQQIVAEILKDQLYPNNPSLDALETCKVLSEYLHQGNLLYAIPSIVQQDLLSQNLRVNINSSNKEQKISNLLWINLDEKSTPDKTLFSLTQTCTIKTDLADQQNPEKILIGMGKDTYLLHGRCEHTIELNGVNQTLNVTSTLESLKINCPNEQLNSYLNRTNENNDKVTQIFNLYVQHQEENQDAASPAKSP